MAGTRADQRDNDPAPSGGYPEAKLRECQECGVCIVFVVRYPELERFRWFSSPALRGGGDTAGRVHRGGSKARLKPPKWFLKILPRSSLRLS